MHIYCKIIKEKRTIYKLYSFSMVNSVNGYIYLIESKSLLDSEWRNTDVALCWRVHGLSFRNDLSHVCKSKILIMINANCWFCRVWCILKHASVGEADVLLCPAAVNTGTSLVLSSLLSVLVFAGMQMFSKQLGSTEWLTILGGFLGSVLFVCSLTVSFYIAWICIISNCSIRKKAYSSLLSV